MKATRRQLIDFSLYLQELGVVWFYSIDEAVDDYLNQSTDSGNETPTVTDNEAKKEFVSKCMKDCVTKITCEKYGCANWTSKQRNK